MTDHLEVVCGRAVLKLHAGAVLGVDLALDNAGLLNHGIKDNAGTSLGVNTDVCIVVSVGHDDLSASGGSSCGVEVDGDQRVGVLLGGEISSGLETGAGFVVGTGHVDLNTCVLLQTLLGVFRDGQGVEILVDTAKHLSRGCADARRIVGRRGVTVTGVKGDDDRTVVLGRRGDGCLGISIGRSGFCRAYTQYRQRGQQEHKGHDTCHQTNEYRFLIHDLILSFIVRSKHESRRAYEYEYNGMLFCIISQKMENVK